MTSVVSWMVATLGGMVATLGERIVSLDEKNNVSRGKTRFLESREVFQPWKGMQI